MNIPSPSLLGRLRDSVPQFLQPIEFRIVETVAELTASGRLVYQEYVKRGYSRPNDAQLKLSIYHALPTTATFIARHRRHGMLGTITLVEDSPLGLPMDEAYQAELDVLRRQGRRLAEATMLALNSELFGQGVFTMFHAKKLLLTLRLFKVMFDYLRSVTPVDELVACFNPKHQVLYDFLELKPLGQLKTYASANGHPAIAQHLNVSQTQRRAKSHVAYRMFYGRAPSPKLFAKKLVLSPDDLRMLLGVLSPALASAGPNELAYLQHCYSAYAFDEILKGVPML